MARGSASAERAARLVFALAIGFAIWPPFPSALAQTQGGFVEKAGSTAIRTRWTASQIRAFLPLRGRFSFPAPYGTEGIRLTNSTDCGRTDCVLSLGPHGRNINNHRGSNAMLIVLSLRGMGPTLFRYDKATAQVQKVGPLFDATSPFASSDEGWYFSAAQPTKLYGTAPFSPRLQRYDVLAKTLETVFDATTQFGDGKYIWQPSSSDDDNVHAATLRDLASHGALGCLAYRADAQQFFYYPAAEDYGDCQIDKSGRWLLIQEDLDGVAGRDDLVVDLESGTEKILPGSDVAGGDSDSGYGYMVAADKRRRGPGAVRVWNFDHDPPNGPVVYYTAAGTGAVGIAHSNAKQGAALGQQYACSASATATPPPRANEIVCFRLDTSLDVLVVTQSMTDLHARGGDRSRRRPHGSLDVTGEYFIWVGVVPGGRADAFMVKVPGRLLRSTSSGAILPAGTATEAALGSPLRHPSREPAQLVAGLPLPDPTLLPVATTLQVPLTAAYDALNVLSRAAGSSYLDPTTSVKIYKLTSATFPSSGANWGHDYSEGGDEVSLPYNGNTRAILVYSGASHWLIDFTPGVGVSNPRRLSGSLAPAHDLSFTFSNNPATPYYAYVSNGSAVVRMNIRTMAQEDGNGWPVTGETDGVWMHQSENDGMFVWMRGPTGPTTVIYEPSTGTKKTYTNSAVNEPRIDRGGRYVGFVMDNPANGLAVGIGTRTASPGAATAIQAFPSGTALPSGGGGTR